MQTITIISQPEHHGELVRAGIDLGPHVLVYERVERFTHGGEVMMGQLVLLIPWHGYGELLHSETTPLASLLAQGRVLVVGSFDYFKEVEDLVLDGQLTFLTSPCPADFVRTVACELLTNQYHVIKNDRPKLFDNYSAAS